MTAGSGAVNPLAAELRERVLTASRQYRRPGQAVPVAPAISPADAFSRAARALDTALSGLTPDGWRRTAIRDLDVQALLGHLIGVEEDTQRALRGGPDTGSADHIASTQPAVRRQDGRHPTQTHAEWRGAVATTLEQLAALPNERLAEPVMLYGLHLPLGKLLVVRAFELWVHENDIRTAVALPLSEPDASTLAMMTDLALDLLPVVVQRAAGPLPGHDIRVVLTGAGGGTWDLPRRPADAPPARRTRIVTDAVSFCRLVGNRVRPSDIDVHVEGDPEIATTVLTAASTLALD